MVFFFIKRKKEWNRSTFFFIFAIWRKRTTSRNCATGRRPMASPFSFHFISFYSKTICFISFLFGANVATSQLDFLFQILFVLFFFHRNGFFFLLRWRRLLFLFFSLIFFYPLRTVLAQLWQRRDIVPFFGSVPSFVPGFLPSFF